MKVSSSIWKGQKKKKNWPQYTVYIVDVSAGVLTNKVKPGTHLEVTGKKSMTHEMKQKCRLPKKKRKNQKCHEHGKEVITFIVNY